jgi:putative chitinase
MIFDRDTYFNEVRASLFAGALTQQQVDGQSVILGLWEHGDTGTPMTDVRWLAYMLATTYHECATRMWPVTEYGSDEYLQGKDYWPYIARGFVGLTWDFNYEKASAALGLIDDRNLVEHPDLALDSLIAARVMFRGMAEGWFTGKRLYDYFNDDPEDGPKNDPLNARQIINGNDCDDLIKGYYESFLEALGAAQIGAVPLPGPDGPNKVITMDITVPPGIEFQLLVNGDYFIWPPVEGTGNGASPET